jgi:enoyl-CoA hydratase
MDTGTPKMIATVDDDGIGWIVYNNPEKHNAMTADMLAAVSRICAAYEADPAVRVVVLRGAGDKAFISGADIAQLDSGQIRGPQAPPDDAAMAERSGTTGIFALTKPVIAMINGWCLGGGMMVALSADIRIASDNAQFGIPAAKLSVGYPYQAVEQLVALCGPGQASEILFAGRRLGAAEAARIGLVNRVLPQGELEEHVRSLATDIAANAPLSHVSSKLSIRAAARGGEPQDAKAIHDAIAAAWASEDHREGTRAFLERRAPRFTGR